MRSLPGLDLRPTADRLRETLFNVLTAGNPLALEGTIWIDLYAGTGAVGIEALSRGAAKVYFVESAPKAAELVRKNLQSLGIAGGFEVIQDDVARTLGKFKTRQIDADFVFIDPPYRMETAYKQTLGSLAETEILKAGRIVIAEHDKRFDPGEECGALKKFRHLKQGDSALSFYRTT